MQRDASSTIIKMDGTKKIAKASYLSSARPFNQVRNNCKEAVQNKQWLAIFTTEDLTEGFNSESFVTNLNALTGRTRINWLMLFFECLLCKIRTISSSSLIFLSFHLGTILGSASIQYQTEPWTQEMASGTSSQVSALVRRVQALVKIHCHDLFKPLLKGI